MPAQFTISDLMEILVRKAGLPREAVTDDPDATLDDIGLDSLAFLQLQAEINSRYGFELDDERPHETFGEILALIREGLGLRESVV
ncbi:acyl carrier protein [Actinomadura craniellae]|uniref:Acyl carrier protein n=1 Tax=Actinomadura craniellae TaxID=2231787 RepID=A0A365H1T1_9ACTN|nr:acyl carrier protein [Actinomadura craniellae]RAY13064.1 acyl carrier protein [Actinomadura craniellae]